jgi:hypothetical protein
MRPEGASVAGRITAHLPGQADFVPVGEAEIFFAHLDQARSQQMFGDRNFVFSGEMRQMVEHLLPRKVRHNP